MKRPYLVYLVAVVVPSALTMAAGLRVADTAWGNVRRHSESRAARTALSALQQDLGTLASSLPAEALPTAVEDSSDVLLARALAGERANGLVPTAAGVEVRVALPPLPGDPPGTVRTASGPLPTSAIAAGRTAGYRTALYLNGQRWMATPPPPGPERLETSTLRELARSPGGVAVPVDEGEGTLVALDGGGAAPAIAVLVAAPSPAPPALGASLLLVLGLLLTFACLAGWIVLTGRPRSSGPLTVFLLCLVPALTAWGLLVHQDRVYRGVVEDAEKRDLARALAVARTHGAVEDPAVVHALTGFHAYRVREGVVEAASRTHDAEASAVMALRAPPPSFTSTGRLRMPGGGPLYVALRLPGGAFLAAVSPSDDTFRKEHAARVRALAMGLAGWLLLVGAVVALGRRSRPEDPLSS